MKYITFKNLSSRADRDIVEELNKNPQGNQRAVTSLSLTMMTDSIMTVLVDSDRDVSITRSVKPILTIHEISDGMGLYHKIIEALVSNELDHCTIDCDNFRVPHEIIELKSGVVRLN